MRRLLLFFAATLFLCGAVNAQGWDTPDSHAKSSNTPIVASVQIDGVAPTLTEDFRLAAFVGDEVRGIAAAHTDGNFWIQVFYNQEDAETIYFCLWDGERIYASCDVTETTSETGDGTPGAPVVMNFSSSTTETQTIAIASGVSWVSFNVETDLEAVEAALVAALPGTTIRISSKDYYAYYNGTRWRGTLNDLDLSQMYMIEATVDGEMTLEGMPVVPAEHSVIIQSGVYWIGYPLSGNMAIADAFDGFALSGDKITSKDGYATYNGTRWRGTLTVLEPGQGYIYESTSTTSRELVFPTATSKK